MFNGYYMHPKTALKYRKNICSVVFVLSMFTLIGAGTEDIYIFVIKNSLCLAAMLIAAVVGKLDNTEP